MFAETVKRNGRARLHRGSKGSATAELAVFLPLAFVLVLGAVDFGRALYELTVVANAANAGAKYAAHDLAHSGDFTGIKEAARDDLRESLETTTVAVDAERYCVCSDGAEVDCAAGICAGGTGGRRTYVRVRVEKPFNTLFTYPGVPSAVVLAREAQVRVQ